MNAKLIESKGDVWDDIIDDSAERESLRARSFLMMEITKHIKKNKLTEENAANQMGVNIQKVSDLLNGKIGELNENTLKEMSEKVRNLKN